jgi:hypothetical protein
MLRRYWQPALAVIIGNAIYLLVERYLPPRARHQPFRIDWGLAVDFWFCLVVYALLSLLKKFRSRARRR